MTALESSGQSNTMYPREVKTILQYLASIPGMIALLEQERTKLDDEAKKQENSASAERNKRLIEIAVRRKVLELDAGTIIQAVDALSDTYKTVVVMRCLCGYSWVQVSTRTGLPNKTVRRRLDVAVKMLADALKAVPMVDEILSRAFLAAY